jgi:hypothetical protein
MRNRTISLFMPWLVMGLLLIMIRAFASEPTNAPKVSVVVVVLTDTNQLPIVLRAITNAVPSAVIHRTDPKLSALETEIKMMERRFKEAYDGLPTTYNSTSTPESDTVLDKLIVAWAQRDKDAAAIQAKKEELNKWKR